ncbi:hypothetical protein N7536_006521 [Penicillium majusculum]|nr:hypothetical protein N7536_006521 [Penicillium majusculum]
MNPPISSPDLSSMQFKAEFRRSEASSIFEIEHHGNRYALKVVSTTMVIRDLQRRAVTSAASVAKQRPITTFMPLASVCPNTMVRSIDRLDPTCHQQWLNGFVNDKFHPSAILLKYLAGCEPLNCVN